MTQGSNPSGPQNQPQAGVNPSQGQNGQNHQNRGYNNFYGGQNHGPWTGYHHSGPSFGDHHYPAYPQAPGYYGGPVRNRDNGYNNYWVGLF